MKNILWKSFLLVSLVLLSIPLTVMGGVLRSSPDLEVAATYDGTTTEGILILMHGSAAASGELPLLTEPLESWGYPVEVFEHTEYYDLVGTGDNWTLEDQGGGSGDLDLVVDGNMQYSAIIFDAGDGLSYTDVETPSRAVRQMFEQYPFLGVARMENALTHDNTMNNLFQIDATGQAAKSLTVSNPTGSWALEPLVGYSQSYPGAQAMEITGKTDNVTVLESFADLTPALTLTSYASGAHAVYFAFKDWGFPESVSMLVRLMQEYSGIPYIKPYYSFEVDDCGDPAQGANADYLSLINWTMSNLGGYPTLDFIEMFLDPDPPDHILKYQLSPSYYYSNTAFNENNTALMAALHAYDDYVVASHGYQHGADWWKWTATDIPVDPFGDEDSDNVTNWKDFTLQGGTVNNNANDNLTMYSAGAFIEAGGDYSEPYTQPMLMQALWFSRMRQVLDLYGYSDAHVLVAPKYHYLDGLTNTLASDNGFDVISARASNEGFTMTMGWFGDTYALDRVSPAGIGSDADIALTPTQMNTLAIQFMGYIGQRPLCLVTNHMWQFAAGDTPGVYELRDSYLSSYGVMTEAGFTLVSTQTVAKKNIGWLWTDMSSVRNSDGSTSLTLNSQAFQDGAERHELGIVMPYSIRQVKVGSNYCIYVDGNELFYGKQSNTSETVQVLSGTYDTSLPRISSVSTPATDVLNAIYDPDTGKISLMLDGTFTTTLNVSDFNKPFLQGTTSIGSNGDSALTIGLAGVTSTESVNLGIIPSAGFVDVAVQNWSTSGDYLRQWTESSASAGTSTMHTMGDLNPGDYYSVWYTKEGGSKTYWRTLRADGSGQINFDYDKGYSTVSFELTAAVATQASVTTNAATLTTTTSTTLNGNLDDLGTTTTVNVSFEWGLTNSYGNTTTPQAMTEIGAFSSDISGLTKGTTYYYRAVADGDGDPVYGEENTFTTSTTPPTVTTTAASSVAATSATLSGNLTSLGTATSVTTRFQWGTVTESYTHTTDNQTQTTPGVFSAGLSGLTAGTTYYYRAVADGDGDPVYGEEVTFTTSTTPPTVTTSAAASVAATSATLNGTLESPGTATSVNVSFEWGATTSYGSETAAQSVTAIGAFTANLSGLTANTTYHFRAKAVGHGSAVYGADMTFTTGSLPDTTAPTISSVDSTDVTKTGATISWTTNEAASSLVEYGLTEEYGSTTTLDTNLVTSHSMGLTELKAGKTYHYRVISKDATNNEAVSADFTFETASKSGGMPVWAWVIIALAVVAVLGAAAFLIRGRLGKA